MHLRPYLVAACVLAVPSVAAWAFWQPGLPGQYREQTPRVTISVEEITAQLEHAAARSKDHEVLNALVGTWDVEGRMWTDPPRPNYPGRPPLVSHGTMKCAWTLGNRFVRCEATMGQKDELKSEALTIYGFDTHTGRHTLAWFDCYSTSEVQASGSYNEATKMLTLDGESTDSGQTLPFRWIVNLTEKDRIVQEFVLGIQPGKWVKTGEAVWTRKVQP